MPQAPPTDRSASLRSETAGAAARGGLDNTNENAGADALVDKALLIRLATKEDVLEDGPVATTMSGIFGGTLSELSVERAAASARCHGVFVLGGPCLDAACAARCVFS